jgi:hypothetical protein
MQKSRIELKKTVENFGKVTKLAAERAKEV